MEDLRRNTVETTRRAPDPAYAIHRAWYGVLALLLISLLTVSTASAHPVLVPRPTLTLADRVLLSDSLVLAREDPQRPFHYAAIKTLKGDPGTTPIDMFMPSQVRRRLALDQELTVLLGRDSKSGKWRALGVSDDDYLQVVRRVMTFSNAWTPKETDNPQRLQEMSSLLGNQDVRLHELAYLEIGRASYASIRKVGADVPLERVRAMLDNPIYFQWRGLDIMLLGLSDDKHDRARVVREMQDLQRLSSDLNLAAWTTAYVEVTGTAGIDQLAQWYFRDADRSRGELRSVTRALAAHANEAPELRQPVVASYRIMLETHPYAAPDIAHDLIAWQRWDFEEQLQQLRLQLARKDPLGVHKVNLYLHQARTHNRKKQR